MAYEQGQYQQPSRPYNGRPGGPPAQGYGQQAPPGRGQQGGYDQYAQDDGYGYGGYDNNGYGQEYDQGYGQQGGGRGGQPAGGRGQYPPHGQGYPPQQQEYYENSGGRGGDPWGRGGSGAGYAARPPPGTRQGGYDNRGGGQRGYPDGRGGPPPPQGRGGRPAPLGRSNSSDPGQISGQMANMDINDPRRPRPGGGKPSQRPPPGADGYGRPGPSRGQPPPQLQPGYGNQRPGPSGGQGYRGPPQNGYQAYNGGASQPTSPNQENFGPPSRAMTMPDQMSMDAAITSNGARYPAHAPGDVGPSAPYNGSAGKFAPPRPSTANGSRPPPQRQYPPQDAQQPFQNGQPLGDPGQPHQHDASISDLYDDYFEPDLQDPAGQGDYGEPQRGQVSGHAPMNRNMTKSQPDFRAQVQPQSAVYEMADEVPPVPQGYQEGYLDQYGNPQQPQNGQRPPMGPVPGRVGLPSRPGPNGGGLPGQNGYGQPKGPAGLPPKAPPVRAGLLPNSVANQANNKPIPERQYGNPAPMAQQPPQQQQQKQQQNPGPLPVGAAPPVTIEEIERLREIIKNTPSDQEAQLTLARKMIEASETIVANIPDQRARGKTREKYIVDAHKILKKLCAGNAPMVEAQFYLADCYGRGALGLEADNKEAFTLYQSAAKAGHAAAAYRTAVCCELGNDEGGGTRKDPLKAIQWYKRAATLGDTPAMYKMGMIQLKGLLGQPKNPREAIGWLKRAAERADAENPHALHELGLLYEAVQPPDGSGVIIRDEAYSLSLFTKSAELGYKFSQFRLGCAHEYGLFNLPISPRESIMWYSRAAVQEEHQSELALSGWYLTGSDGVLQQSDTEAYLWARKAAMAGLAKAEYAMGYFTEVGIGAVRDLEGAKRWYWRAAAQNYPKARERLEDLKKGGNRPQLKSRERISRSTVGKHNEGECAVM